VIVKALASLAMVACVAATSSAQSVEDFYKNRQVTLISAAGAGGGYDIYSRLLAQFIGRHIPGEPHIVVQNMEGADGLTAINYVANIAPKDGSVISDTFSTMPFYLLVDGRNAKFDPRTLNWLGSLTKNYSVCIAWHTSSFKTLDDVMERSMRVSGTGALGWRSILPHLYNIVAGSKFEVITGYSTPNDYLAIERGEVDGSCTTYTTLLASEAEWISQKKIIFLAQFGSAAPPGLEGVPMGLDRVKTAEDRAAMELILAQQQTGGPYVAPPGVPADRVQALQAAFATTIKDPDFLAAAQKVKLPLIEPMEGAQIRALIQHAYQTPPDIVNRARALLQMSVKR
jgi:tripartite-type tricarboxylate transporter receptor subunit TctC